MNAAEAIGQHRQTVAKYLEELGNVDDARWQTPLAPGKWSPAQVTDHVVRSYDTVLGEVRA